MDDIRVELPKMILENGLEEFLEPVFFCLLHRLHAETAGRPAHVQSPEHVMKTETQGRTSRVVGSSAFRLDQFSTERD
jgi:hypothetical protein